MLCKQCGFSFDSKVNACPNCGNISKDQDRVAGKSGSSSNGLKILAGLILAGLAAIFLWTHFSNTMPDAASGQLKALKEGRLKEAYEGYTSKPFRSSTSLEQFKQFIESFPVFSKNKSMRIIDRNFEHDRGVVKAMIVNDQGIETPVSYQMVKENDRWLIENIKVGNFAPDPK